MSALRFGVSPSLHLQILPACEAAIRDGELRVLEVDWKAVKDQFSDQEKAILLESILIEMLQPRGWYLPLKGIPRDLLEKLIYELSRVGGLRGLGE